MRPLMMTLAGCLILISLATADDEQKEQGFSRIFDGRTLKGWEGNLKIFRVEDGAIVGGSLKERIPNNEFLCTEKTYNNFELRLKAKLVGKGDNAGIQFRSRRIPNHHEVIGYQCDIGGRAGNYIWGHLYDESRRRRVLAQGDQDEIKKVLKPDGWNDFTIRCEAHRVQIWLNGQQTVDYAETDEKVKPIGVIGLQIHGGPPAEAWYKDIRIKELKKSE